MNLCLPRLFGLTDLKPEWRVLIWEESHAHLLQERKSPLSSTCNEWSLVPNVRYLHFKTIQLIMNPERWAAPLMGISSALISLPPVDTVCFPPLLFYFNHSSEAWLEQNLHQGVQLKNSYQILLRQGEGMAAHIACRCADGDLRGC